MLSKPLAKFFVQGKRSFSAFKSSSVLYQQGGQIPAFKGPTKLFINNKFVDAISGKRFETTNPATGDVITTVSDAQKEDVDVAVKAARSAFETGSEWRKTDPRDRARLLYRFADLLDKHKEELAVIESLDNGKPVKDSLNVDIFLAIDCLRYYAGWADKISGSVLNIRGDFDCYVRREPVGVVGQIIPWNFPILMLAWKLGPALATGCTVVVKPAEQTPLSALKIGELIAEVFPKGVVNILPGQGITAGAPLVKHRDVDKIAFTGSTEVGKLILSEASSDLKRVSLELGGKSPVIVFADADLDKAVHWTHIGLFLNQGQCCIAGSRIYVEDKVYDEFVKRAAEKAKQRIVGNPFDNKTDQGPQVSQEQLETVLNYIEKGKKEGARLVTGGGRVGSRGYFVQPTVFADVKDEMTISKEEIFGPVMGISKFSTLEEAVKRANNHMYGLGAAVFTENLAKAHSVANRIRAGTVYLNCYDIFDASAPFGGYKQSGHGRELGPSGLDLYLEDKTVIVPLLPNSK